MNLKKFNTAAEQQPLLGMLVYSLVGFIRPAIYIFLLPLYLNVFTESEYAIYDLMMITSGLLMVFVTFRLNAAMLTQYYDYYQDATKKHKFLSSLFSFSLLIACMMALIGYVVGPTVFDLVFRSDEIYFFPYGFTILLYAVLGEVNNTYFIYLKNEKRLGRYVFVVLFQILLVILLQFICIISLDMGLNGAFIGMLIANVCTTLLIILLEKGIITLSPDWTMLKIAFKFSIALVPYLLIYWGLTRGGKFVLENNADLATVGIFAVLMTVSGVIIIVVEAVVNGVRPFLFETFARDNKTEDASKVDLFTQLIVILPLFAVPAIILVATNIGLITTKASYEEIGQYVTLAAAVTYMLVYGKLYYQQLIFVKRSDLVTRLSFVVLLVFVIGLMFLVPTYKIWGVLFATLVANIAMAGLFYIYAQQQLYIPYNQVKLILSPLLFFLLLFALQWILVSKLEYSLSQYGLIQFLVLTLLLLASNYKTIGQYKSLFLAKKS